MKHTFLLIGAAALAASAPALAKPGHGQGHGKFKADKVKVASHGGHYGYGIGGCPPGLAKKGNGCMPPGQAKKYYNVGQRYNRNYGNLWSYNQIPYDLRNRYDFDQSSRYYYRDGYVYRVNPRTMLIQQVVSALIR